ncbi:MAG: hypothetical protein JJE52_09740 [Acidimicrobiia bacterium]|nr:hypothetical protein [Acidimicrobiia bacterium]
MWSPIGEEGGVITTDVDDDLGGGPPAASCDGDEGIGALLRSDAPAGVRLAMTVWSMPAVMVAAIGE